MTVDVYIDLTHFIRLQHLYRGHDSIQELLYPCAFDCGSEEEALAYQTWPRHGIHQKTKYVQPGY